jgi:DnaJ-class molecular chaperone
MPTCSRCNGTGKVYSSTAKTYLTCAKCNGSGHVTKN